MSRKACCYDNATMESFWSSLKNELVHRCAYETRAQARQSIFEWIEVYYNRVRLHSSLDYKSLWTSKTNSTKTTHVTRHGVSTKSGEPQCELRPYSSSYLLDSITLWMYNQPSSGALRLDLFSDQGGRPGSSMGSLVTPTVSTDGLTTEMVTFSGNGLILEPNQTYWAVLSATSLFDFQWMWTRSETGSGTGFTSVWDITHDAGDAWTVFASQPQLMRVEATPVPEVTGWSIIVVSALSIVVLRWRLG
jgi:hypothetical protein